MTRFGSILRVLLVLGVIVGVTAAMYLVAGLSVGAWLTHERSAMSAWLIRAPAWNQAMVVGPVFAIGLIAGRLAIAVRTRRRIGQEA